MQFSDLKKNMSLKHKYDSRNIYYVAELWEHGALIGWQQNGGPTLGRSYMAADEGWQSYEEYVPPPKPITKLKYQIVWAYNPATREVNACFGKFDTALQDAIHIKPKDKVNKYHVLRVDTVEYDGEVV